MLTRNPRITAAGLALFTNQAPGFSVSVTHIALGASVYDPAGTETALKSEFARFPIETGADISPSQIQVGALIKNADPQGRTPNNKHIGEIGFYVGSTLLAVLSQGDRALFYKSPDLDVPISYVLDFSTLPPGSLTVGAMGLSANIQLAAQTAQAEGASARNSASIAAATLKTIQASYYGGHAVAPTTRPDGTARQKGDRYFDTTAGAEKTWSGAAWYVPNVDSAAFAASGGSSLVGNGGESVKDSLDALQLPDYAALRAYSGPRKSVYVADLSDASMFVLDAADTTTADNGDTVIVTAGGKRFKRSLTKAEHTSYGAFTVANALDSLLAKHGALQSGRESLITLLGDLNTRARKVTWVGDSITEQGKPGMGSGAGTGIGYTTFIEQAFPRITYSNQGIGGNTTLDVINRIADITATGANLYVLAIGINDARYNDSRGATTQTAYIDNIRSIINSCKNAGGDVVVLSIWPSFWKDQYANLGRKRTDDRFKQWNAALESYCALEFNVPFVDAYSHIVKAINFHNVTDLIPDGVHPDYAQTAGKKLYAAAVLRGAINGAEFRSAFVPTGTVGYKIRVLDNGQADKLAQIKNIRLAPYHKDWFAFSADPSVGVTGLFGSYNGAYAGYKNKIGDFPFEFIVTADQLPTAITTVSTGLNKGIRAFELFRSDDPAAFSDVSHPSWSLINYEYTNLGLAFNLLPRKRQGVFYRVQFDDSTGGDGTGGTTGTYIKVKKIWPGVEPVRINFTNILDQGPSYRPDLIFSSVGGDANSYYANVANTYPLHVMFEAPQSVPTITIESVGEASRNIKNWKLFRSHDPLCINDAAHSSWLQVASGVGDATIAVP